MTELCNDFQAHSVVKIIEHVRPITLEKLQQLDKDDDLKTLSTHFRAPTISELKRDNSRNADAMNDLSSGSERPSIYFCGNSLGLQPLHTRDYILAQLNHWHTKAVYGHFVDGAPGPKSPPCLDSDEAAKTPAARIGGAHSDEVAIMQTLTVNLHLLMASFYRPKTERYKIILEGKAFPSDHYAIESHIQTRDIDPAKAMVLIEPPTDDLILPLSHILSTIDQHAASTALLLLPGVQYYTGQLFDMQHITAYAQERGITVGWDLAHAVGNVPLELHNWNVDFAAWCNYKYMNCGPGAIAGLFVHERHTRVAAPTVESSLVAENEAGLEKAQRPAYRTRLAGWWGSMKDTRFSGINKFVPLPGASGFQLSNPSALDLAAVRASMAVFEQTNMAQLRAKSLRLTAVLEHLLMSSACPDSLKKRVRHWPPYRIITPANPQERGAQLSIKLEEGLLEPVTKVLEDEGVVVDERKPDVIRVAPTPLYNTFEEVWRFCEIFGSACEGALLG